MAELTKPLPSPSPDSNPFWAAARQHRLLLQHCGACAQFIFYPRHRCARCGGAALEWRPVSGTGTVYSFTVVRRTTNRPFAADVPYVVAIVALAEGPRMTTNIVGCSPDAVRCGMPVEVCFDDVTAEMTLVKFRPAA